MEGTGHRRGPSRKRCDTRESPALRAHGKRQMGLDGTLFTMSNGKREADSASDAVVEIGRPTHLLLGDRK